MAYLPPSNVSGTVGMFQWINGTISNFFFPGIILATFFIIMFKQLASSKTTVSKAFSSASFICMILSVLARVLNFVNTAFMTIFIILTAVGGIWMHIENN